MSAELEVIVTGGLLELDKGMFSFFVEAHIGTVFIELESQTDYPDFESAEKIAHEAIEALPEAVHNCLKDGGNKQHIFDYCAKFNLHRVNFDEIKLTEVMDMEEETGEGKILH